MFSPVSSDADVFKIKWTNYEPVINGECGDIKQLLSMIKRRTCVGELCEHVANLGDNLYQRNECSSFIIN